MIETAKNIVRRAFPFQIDKAGQPYLFHLERVFKRITEIYDDPELSSIALLHDLLEDCPEWDEKRLSKHFNSRIVAGVVALTKQENEQYSDYLNRVKANDDAIKVKIADLEDNMDITRLPELNPDDISRLKKYHKAYRSLVSLP